MSEMFIAARQRLIFWKVFLFQVQLDELYPEVSIAARQRQPILLYRRGAAAVDFLESFVLFLSKKFIMFEIIILPWFKLKGVSFSISTFLWLLHRPIKTKMLISCGWNMTFFENKLIAILGYVFYLITIDIYIDSLQVTLVAMTRLTLDWTPSKYHLSLLVGFCFENYTLNLHVYTKDLYNLCQ